jgi:glycosyltransferase involved in cell wall biosynthesis
MSKFPPLFSVVIPTYNCLPLLKQAIQSVLSQTEQDFEILVVDNSSTDGTKVYLDSLKEPRIHSFEVENSGVIALSRNVGIKNATGAWVCFLDADDIWYKNKLETCHEYINDKVDVFYHDLKIYGKVNFFGRKVLRSRVLSTPVLTDLLVHGNAINNSSVVVRKEILERVNYVDESPDIIAAEDYNTWLKIAEISEQFFYINKVLGEYFIGADNISHKDMSVCSRNASNDFIKSLNKKQLTKYNSLMAYTHGRYMYLNKEYNLAIESLSKVAQGGSLRLRIRSLYMLSWMYISGSIRNLSRLN